MSQKQEKAALSKIQRQLGVIEGVATGLEDRFATVLLDTVEELEHAVEELLQAKKS